MPEKPVATTVPQHRTERLQSLFEEWIDRATAASQSAWYSQALAQVREAGDDFLVSSLRRSLALAPRRLGLAELSISQADFAEAQALRPDFDPSGLSVDQAARIGLLLASHRTDERFAATLMDLCRHADVREHATYLSGLALYPAPLLIRRVAEAGVRSAITPVFEAVAHRNPYPSEMFDEASWNQMILKAAFVGVPLGPIQGLARRANPTLAGMLRDYMREREVAGRSVSEDVRCHAELAAGTVG